jgi:hypothetical protein
MPDIYTSDGDRQNQEQPQSQPQQEQKPNTAPEPSIPVTSPDEKAGTDKVVTDVLNKVGEIPGKKLWGAYNVHPGKKFMNEQADEEVVMLLRGHPIINLQWIITAIGLLIFPELLSAVGVFTDVPFKVVFVGKLVWYLVTMGFAFEKFLDWYYSIFIVTNERLVDIDFTNLLNRQITYANLDHIEQPSMVSGGLVRSLFKYGDIFISTAAEGPPIDERAIPYPDRVIDIISELSEELEKRRGKSE